jgi:Phosphotransferase enzyme family
MPENVMEQIVSELRQSGAAYYPEHVELRNVRVVGHTPKTDHYIYDIVVDFADGSERLAAKVYRATKSGPQAAKASAFAEYNNLSKVYEVFHKKKLTGVPRPVGNFTELGAVVAEKLGGVPFQSIIMKAALLPGYADHGTLKAAAMATGEWLRKFHKATADMPEPFDSQALLADLEKLCNNCKGSGLDDAAVKTIIGGARSILSKAKKVLPSSAVLNDFCPLNVVVSENGVGFCDFARTSPRGNSFEDVALFLASVEALEKYPFCNRAITGEVQEAFVEAYGASPSEQAMLRVLKMKALLSMFAQGRVVKESAIRKKVMWATVMKRFIQQAAERSMAPAA